LEKPRFFDPSVFAQTMVKFKFVFEEILGQIGTKTGFDTSALPQSVERNTGSQNPARTGRTVLLPAISSQNPDDTLAKWKSQPVHDSEGW
jgi:hypothetical protein